MQIPRSLTIAAPADEVWHLLTDTSRWGQWGPSIRGARVDDPASGGVIRLGSTGAVQTPIGAWLPFTITRFSNDPARREWGWKVVGVAATDHWVEPTNEGCRLGMSVPVWAPAYLTIVELGMRNIRRIAEKEANTS